MTTTVPVKLGPRSYDVVVGRGALKELGRRAKKLFGKRQTLVVADTTVARLYGRAVLDVLSSSGFHGLLAVVPEGETTKSVEIVNYLWGELAGAGAGRDALVVALGGGVVGDIAGFAASTWNRGIPFIQVATTLLAQVDAAIGGKTGINLPIGKNLVGTFHQPSLVLADLDTLKSLPDREYLAGLAEVIKYGLIGDPALFKLLETETDAVLKRDMKFLEAMVARCAAHKARIVAKDERESGLRMLLNLGHTFGHAVEAETGFRRYLHGEAVGMGLCAAAVLSEEAGVATEKGFADRVYDLVADCGLPVRAAGLSAAALEARASGDKKARGGKPAYVVCEKVGKAGVRSDLPPAAIKAAWKKLVTG